MSDANRPVAIRWTHPAENAGAALSLPSGRLELDRCVFHRVSAGIDCRTIGALGIGVTNTLYQGSGPLVRLDHYPEADEPFLLRLARTTTRASGPLLSCDCRAKEDPTGKTNLGRISIETVGCVFAPSADTALLHFSGTADLLAPVTAAVRWSGQGSLVSPEARIAAWEMPDGRRRVIDDSTIAISGLVISEVEFQDGAGQKLAAGSRIVRWQAPLRSAEPPGIDPDLLP